MRVAICKVCGTHLQPLTQATAADLRVKPSLEGAVVAHYLVVHPDRTPDDNLLPNDWWALNRPGQ